MRGRDPSARLPAGSGARRSIKESAQAALWALSNGRCYYPGCPAPVVVEVRPGVYRKNVVIAHIYGVRRGAARFRQVPDEVRDSFAHLILLCQAHHSEVDDPNTAEDVYPPEVLLEWKKNHEGPHQKVLDSLEDITEERLTELVVSAFTSPLERLQEITAKLERTGAVNANTVAELRQIVDVLINSPVGVDGRTVSVLAYAADVFGSSRFAANARRLGEAADVLPSVAARIGRAMGDR